MLIDRVTQWGGDFPTQTVGQSLMVHADCFEWLKSIPPDTFHAVVTDPPYGVKEYQDDQLEKRENGTGGVWRIPPAFDGHQRAPLPRFTAFNQRELDEISAFFVEWSRLIVPVLRPGGHVFLASNNYLSQLVFAAVIAGGLEFRGQIIRLVSTLRGGDRPKNAEQEFPGVSSLPRGNFEPWGLFRKPMPNGMRVSDCLRQYQTGGLRRNPDDKPFGDVIPSERTPRQERQIANHPSLKPQSFLRQMVYAALPLGEGLILDPFAGSGSTLAAAEAFGLSAIGVERHPTYYNLSLSAIPQLASLKMPLVPSQSRQLSFILD